MSNLKNHYLHSLKNILAPVIIFTFVFFIFFVYTSISNIDKSMRYALSTESNQLEKLINSSDLISVQRLFLRIKPSPINYLSLKLSKEFQNTFYDKYSVGPGNFSKVWTITRSFKLSQNGLNLGYVFYSIDVKSLINEIIREYYGIFTILVLSSLFTIWWTNRANIKTLQRLDRNLTKMAKLDGSSDLDLYSIQEELLKTFKENSQYAFSESLYKLLSKVTGYFEIKTKVESSEAIKKMTSQVSHDIKSPLVALKMATQHIDDLPEDIRIIIRGSVQRIEDIANVLSAKKKVKSEANYSRKERVLLSSLIEEIVTEKRMQCRSKLNINIDSNLDVSSYGLFAYIDPREIKRLCSNVINNSIEAFDHGGIVTINLTSMEDDKNRIIIEDNGKGIPKEHLDRIFVRGETFGKASGSGLGLAHAKETVESLGGHIFIKSTPNVGTKVIIDLPKEKEPHWFVPQLLLQKDSTIVILDDDSSIHNVWNERFKEIDIESLNVKVAHLSNPKEFHNWMEKNDISRNILFLSDYELIGAQESGLDLIEKYEIQKQSILITSHYENNEIRFRCKKIGLKLIPKSLANIVPIKSPVVKDIAMYNTIHCDDDKYLRMSWKMSNNDPKVNILSIANPKEFSEYEKDVSKEASFYIDYDFGNGNISGLEWAKELYTKGYRKLFLSTGHSETAIKDTSHLLGFVSKRAPWA
ncbi:MAG: HAMP domain-containing histidine kinase [Bacteriovoracaceae bacterium]|nr:HAMP domain-containing histidine kinase [Bacteriovoracaceae bacterium]